MRKLQGMEGGQGGPGQRVEGTKVGVRTGEERLCQPLSESCLHAGGDGKPVEGLEKGVTFRG